MSMEGYNRDAFKFRGTKILDLLNEVLIAFSCYVYFYFTQFCPSPDLRYRAGFVKIAIACVLIAINLTVIFYTTLSKLMYR